MSSETGNEKQIKTRMAERTPVKVLPSSGHQYVCKCCNSTFSSHPIDLFGKKSNKENILLFVISLTGLAFMKEDGFPNKICRSCYNLVRKFREFKDMCLQCHKEQQSSRLVRIKRGKQVMESPSIQEQQEAKRRKSGATERESSTSVRESLPKTKK